MTVEQTYKGQTYKGQIFIIVSAIWELCFVQSKGKREGFNFMLNKIDLLTVFWKTQWVTSRSTQIHRG